MSSRVYLFLTLALYAVGAASVLLHALTRRRLLTSWAVGTTFAGFVVHTAALSQRWTEVGRFPAVGLHDGATFLAWATVLAFLVANLRSRVEALGLATFPLAFVLVLAANFTSPQAKDDKVLQSLFLPIHTTCAFLGFGAVFVAFAMGCLYLIQERELKSRSPRRFYYLVPSLESCDTLGARATVVGFVFLSVTIVTGVMWNLAARGRPWTGDPKEWAAVAAWAMYVAVLFARGRSGWGGRRAARLTIAGFVAVVTVFVFASGGIGAAR
jgi:ABC-type transport system involved in cytochrome c biogenesis permease subunit